ncbi:hypothetical protein Agau_C202052 [Agrobacterium tumefaciens F2]|nr:hypothetical protein Agau_C202052 [Agrobacterium tumefaciens F2]
MALPHAGTWKRSVKTVFLIAKRPAFVTTRGVCARKLRQSRRQDDFAGSDPSRKSGSVEAQDARERERDSDETGNR